MAEMSRSYGPEIKFSHTTDCELGGCPGHTIREVFCRSTDTYSFEIDGKSEYVFDENMFAALLKAHEGAKEK